MRSVEREPDRSVLLYVRTGSAGRPSSWAKSRAAAMQAISLLYARTGSAGRPSSWAKSRAAAYAKRLRCVSRLRGGGVHLGALATTTSSFRLFFAAFDARLHVVAAHLQLTENAL